MSGASYPKKSLGQHWLTDPASLDAMCAAAGVESADAVLEVGPGLGSLTEVLLDAGATVTAVERDPTLLSALSNTFAGRRFYLIEADILAFNAGQLPAGYKVVANIPYYLTSHLIQVLSEAANPPSVAVLLVQKEVAERVAARPGQMSILGVTAQYYWEVSLGKEVPAHLFTPPPKVDSQILILRRRTQPLFPGVDSTQFFRLVKAGFAQRRKTLLNSLSGGLHLSRESVGPMLVQAGINPSARAQTLSLPDWHRLYQVYDVTGT